MHGHPMSKNHMIIGGLIISVIGLMALLETMGTITVFGANGLPWLYLLIIFMGLKKLLHPFICPQCKM